MRPIRNSGLKFLFSLWFKSWQTTTNLRTDFLFLLMLPIGRHIANMLWYIVLCLNIGGQGRLPRNSLSSRGKGSPWNRYNMLIHFVDFCRACMFLQLHSLKHAFVIFRRKCHFLCSREGSPFEPDELGFAKYVWNSAVELW